MQHSELTAQDWRSGLHSPPPAVSSELAAVAAAKAVKAKTATTVDFK